VKYLLTWLMKIKRYSSKKFFRFSFYCYLLFAACYLLNGCATVPTQELSLPTYNINGTTYLPLISLCDLKKINWEYDTLTKTITLKKDAKEINLSVGNSIVLVDGVPKDLRHPVDFYEGAVVVPYRFKSEIVDVLFRPSYPAQRSYAGAIRKIVIDPGHGGRDPGAIGRSGLREKDVALDIAKRLKTIFESSGFEVYLTRDYDKFIPLEERARFANRKGTDIFISIHANANRARSLSGFEAYYISNKIDNERRALVSAENTGLKLENASSYAESLDLKATVWDIIYGQNRSESIALGQHICRYVTNNLDTRVLGVKGAPFYVLKWTQMPALLLEVGFLSNTYEEKLLRNGFYRQQIAEAIAGGLRSYCQDYRLTLQSN